MSWGKELENFVKCAPKRFAYFMEHGGPGNWWSESACKKYHRKRTKRKRVRFKKYKRNGYGKSIKREFIFKFICFAQ